jgi:hypothetical protein
VAEFVTVMSEFMRLCDSFKHCEDCPVNQAGFSCDCDNQGYSKTGAKELEHIIMKWASEHPEPVYPTWADYISALVIKDICTGKISGPETVLTYAMNTHIPADIAQKLGIEPKEE